MVRAADVVNIPVMIAVVIPQMDNVIGALIVSAIEPIINPPIAFAPQPNW